MSDSNPLTARPISAPLRDPEFLVLAFIVLTIPLEVSKQLFPVQWLELARLGMIVGLAFLARRAAARRLLPVAAGLALAVAIVIAVDVGSTLWTRWPNGVKSTAALVVYAFVALYVGQTVRDRVRLGWLAILLVASGAYVALIVVAQAVFDFYLWNGTLLSVLGRRNATFADPNITSRFLTLALLALLGLLALARPGDRRVRPLLLGIPFLFGIAQALTQSRAGWLVAALTCIAWLLLVRPRLVSALATASLVAGFAVVVVVNPSVLDRAGDVAFDIGSTGGGHLPGDTVPVRPLPIDPILDRVALDDIRRYLDRAGVAMFLDHPLVGVGKGGFQPELLGPYYGYIPERRQANPVSLPHTELVRIAAETGILGLAAFSALLVAVLIALGRAVRRTAAWARTAAVALGLGLLAILISSQFEGRLYDEPYLWLLLGLLAGLVGALPRRAPER